MNSSSEIVNKTKIENLDEVLEMFKELSYKKQIRAYRTGLRNSVKIIQKQAKKNLRRVIRKGSYSKRNKYGKKIWQGIRTAVWQNGKVGKAHIMGDYRLKWIEMGTAERWTKRFLKNSWRDRIKKHGEKYAKIKHRYRGKMNPTYFFRDASALKADEAQASLMNNVRESIRKIYEKHRT